MAQTVFWSWQSDQPSRETRSLIRDALIAALDRIAVDLEEADRPEIDHDTKDMPGSPDIVASILAKIEAAAVFIADVTPIAVTDGGKHVANPNVLIELGGKEPWRFRLGAEGLSETSWPNRFGSDGGAFALEGRVEREIELAEINEDTVAAAVREVFNAMAEAYGLPPLTIEQFRIAAGQ